MQLDVLTLMVALCAAMLLFSLQFIFFWSRDRSANWLLWWAAPFLLATMGLLLYIPRGRISDFLSIGIANALLISAFGLAWQAARIFERRRPILWPIALAVGVWLTLCLVPAFMAMLSLRIIASSIAIAGFLVLMAFELWRGRSEALASRWPAIIVTLVYAGFVVTRIITAHGAPFPIGPYPGGGPWVSGWGLVAIVFTSFFSMLMVSMTKERQELKQRNFALSDPLTGLFNRRAFADQGERMARRARQGNEPLALLVLDLDHFKSINDRFGHDVGDKMLQAFASVARSSLRPADLLYRMGGEEFCFLLAATGQADAMGVAERFRQDIAAFWLDGPQGRVSATVSIGVATTDHTGFDIALLLAAGDAALYVAKTRGRNRVVAADAADLRRPALDMRSPKVSPGMSAA